MHKKLLVASIILIPVFAASRGIQGQGCNPNPTPFTDLGGMPSGFCQAVAQAYFSGLTFGTSPTTYSPSGVVTRDQMSAFITRTMDQSLKRGSGRAVVKKWWIPTPDTTFGLTNVGSGPVAVEFDGADLWVANMFSNSVSRVCASDGKLLETWTGATNASSVLIAKGRVFVTGKTTPGKLYMIDPRQTPGAVTTVMDFLPDNPIGIAFDGNRIWTVNAGTGGPTGSLSIITPGAWTAANTTGFFSIKGIVYDGSNMWITDGALKRLDANGNILQTIEVGANPVLPVFDGTNLWVPKQISGFADGEVVVVRAIGPLTGTILARLRDNRMRGAYQAAFDGERVLVTDGGGVFLWKAADFTFLGSFGGWLGGPTGGCSDGINFWVTLNNGQLARF